MMRLQIGMIQKTNAEEIEDLALIPVGGAINGANRFNFRILAGKPGFQTHPLLRRDRLQMINHLKTRLSGISIHPGHRAEPLETKIRLRVTQRSHNIRRARLQWSIRRIRPCQWWQGRPSAAAAELSRRASGSGIVVRALSRRPSGGSSVMRTERNPRLTLACAQSSTPFFQMKKKPARISTTKTSISRNANILSCL